MDDKERTMYNLYPGRINDGFYSVIEAVAFDDIDLVEFLLGDGQ